MSLSSGRWIAAVLLSGWLAVSCRQPLYTYHAPPAAQPVVRLAPQLVFLTFQLQADSSRLQLQRSTVVAGHAKEPAVPLPAVPYLLVSLLDAQHQSLVSTALAHPLVREVEYLTGQAQFARRTVRLREAEFVVRLPLPAQTRHLQVQEVGARHTRLLLSSPYPAP